MDARARVVRAKERVRPRALAMMTMMMATSSAALALALALTLALAALPASAADDIDVRAATPAEREDAMRYLRSLDPAGAPDPATLSLDVWRERDARGRPGPWQQALTAWTRPVRGAAGTCHAVRQRHERAGPHAAWHAADASPAAWLAGRAGCDATGDDAGGPEAGPGRVFLDAPLDDALLAGLLRDEQRWLGRAQALIQGAESCGAAWRCPMVLRRVGRPWILGPWRPDDIELRYDAGDCPGAAVVLRPLKGELTPWAAFCPGPR